MLRSREAASQQILLADAEIPHKLSATMTIPPLIAGGLMLSYRCSNACRHCLYRCSPNQPDEWMSLDMARRILERLQGESRFQSLHLAGGEPALHMQLLENVIGLTVELGVPLAYVETNASWCTDGTTTREQMKRLHDAGLPAILISVSPFHNEFVPFAYTRRAVETAREVFGPHNVIIYLPQMYELLSRMPDDGTHTLSEFCRWGGIPEDSEMIPQMYGVIAGGRATHALRGCYTRRPADAFERYVCRGELMSTTHFHIDLYGNLFTGLCAGIVPATVDNLHPRVLPETHPCFAMLCDHGPHGLMNMARAEYGFEPHPDGYVSKCDLCYDMRKFMVSHGEYAELRPHSFYSLEAG